MTDVTYIQKLAELAEKHGLGIVLSIIIVVIVFMLIKFILKQWNNVVSREKEVLEQSAKERSGWQTIMDGFLSTLKDHSNDAKHRYKGLEDANKFQREEHIKMIESLTEVVSQNKVMSLSLQNAVSSLKDSHDQRSKENNAILKALEKVVDKIKA